MSRLLFIDESLSKRLAGELRNRGRPAVASATEGMQGLEDPALLETLVQRFPGAVLVTADDHLPADHVEAVRTTGVVVATIDTPPPGFTTDAWRRDVVHRWAHRMQEQGDGTVRRYGLVPREWTTPRRPAKSSG